MARPITIRLAAIGALMLAFFATATWAQDPLDREVAFDIKPQSIDSALLEFSKQAQIQVMMVGKAEPSSATTEGVKGTFAISDALRQLLRDTGLAYEMEGKNTIRIVSPTVSSETAAMPIANAMRLSGNDVEGEGIALKAAEEKLEEVQVGIPEILVVGTKSLNTDIKRTRDDFQPYVVFDAQTIERSGVTTLNDFFKQRLPMNTAAVSFNQESDVTGNMSSINLRGLGASQTLILIDGKRQSSLSFGGTVQQPDLNGIPLAAIERIEVLPTTASGIYGGSAVGGVVNVILRRDYEAAELRVKYGNTFDSGSDIKQIDLALGHPWREGKTRVLLNASWNEDAGLVQNERDFRARRHAAILANNPDYYLNVETPLGATPNIRSASGDPLFGPGTPSFTSVPVGYAGGGGLAPLQTNAGQYDLGLGDTAQSGGGLAMLRHATSVRSANVTLRNDFTSSLSGFLELGASSNRSAFPRSHFAIASSFTLSAAAPNNPFGQAVVVSAPVRGDGNVRQTVEQQRAAAGLIAKLPANWTGEIDYAFGRTDSEYFEPDRSSALSSALRNGTVDVLKDTLQFAPDLEAFKLINFNDYRSISKNLSLRVGGPFAQLPAGRPALTFLVERRENTIGDAGGERQNTGPGTDFITSSIWAPGTQDVDSIYLELTAPLLTSLDLQLAARHDRYTTTAGPLRVFPGDTPASRPETKLDSSDPTVGLRWRPVKDVMFRASYGTGFLPPGIHQIGAPVGPFEGALGPLIDPARPGDADNFTYTALFGGNPNLKPEESKSWSAGLVLTPRALEALRFSVDYTNIKKTDAVLEFPQLSLDQLLVNEASFPGRVVRGPPDGLFPVGPVIAVDLTNLNASKVDVEAYDFQADYALKTASLGEFAFFAIGTRQTDYRVQLLPTSWFDNLAGIGYSSPLKWKFNAGVNWTWHEWSAGWTARYLDSYLVADPAQLSSAEIIANQGGRKVSSQTYHDLYVGYHLPESLGFLANSELQLEINNVFDHEPPLDMAYPTSSAYYSPFGDPRQASYYLSLRVNF